MLSEGNLINRKSVKNVIIACSSLVLLFIIFIETWAAYYTVFSADDFSIATAMTPYKESFWAYLAGAILYTKNMYLNWQGTYFSMFTQSLLNPLSGFGLLQLRIIMVFNALLFFSSLIFFIFSLFKMVIKENHHIKLFYCACIVFVIMNSRAYPEIFYWFCGAMVYCVPAFCLLFSLSFFVLSNITSKKKILYIVLTLLFSIGSQGGVLTVAGTGCYIILVLCFLFWLQTKRFSFANLAVFVVYFCGAIINVIAPGNFVRHDVIEDGVYPISALKQAIVLYFKEIKLITVNNKYCIIFLLLMLCGIVIYEKKEIDMKIYTVASVFLLAAPIVAAFPVMLGYGTSAIEIFPNRGFFIVNTITVIVLANLAIVAGYWMVAFVKIKGIKPIWLTGSFGVLLFILLIRSFTHFSLADMYVLRTSKQLYDRTIQNYYEDCKVVFNYLSDCEEDDVMIEEFPASIENYGNFEISASPDHWINRSVAEYYNKNSIGYEKLVGHN